MILASDYHVKHVFQVTFFIHDFWTIENNEEPPFNKGVDTRATEKQHSTDIPTFMSNFDNEFVHFFKNVGMVCCVNILKQMQLQFWDGVII